MACVSKHQIVISLLLFCSIYFLLDSSISLRNQTHYLYRFEDTKFVDCISLRLVINGSSQTMLYDEHLEESFDVCDDSYPQFTAYQHMHTVAAPSGDCWSSFNYKTGMPNQSPALKRNIADVLNTSCVDYKVRPFVNVDDSSEVLTQKCRSCGLVFSSGRLIDKNYGAEIDSNDCVIRLNNAPTKHYERDVGRKTTMRVLAHNSLYDTRVGPHILSVLAENGNETVLVWDTALSGKRSALGKTPAVNILALARRLSRLRPQMKVFYGRAEYYENLWLEWTGTEANQLGNTTWISTGFYSLVLALNTCDRVDIYGLASENTCELSWRYAPYHYYPSNQFNQESMADCYFFRQNQRKASLKHDYFAEQHLFRDWARIRGNVNIVPMM